MQKQALLLTHEMVFVNGNPYGGPDRVTYGSKASANRAARQETRRGLEVTVQPIDWAWRDAAVKARQSR